jgi:hypothetical protein
VAIDEALVYAFIAATQQHGAGSFGELLHHGLGQGPAGGREVHHRHLSDVGASGSHGGQRTLQRLNQHHHAGSAAIGPVIDAAIGVQRIVAQGPQPHIDLAGLERAARDALCQVRPEQVRE